MKITNFTKLSHSLSVKVDWCDYHEKTFGVRPRESGRRFHYDNDSNFFRQSFALCVFHDCAESFDEMD